MVNQILESLLALQEAELNGKTLKEQEVKKFREKVPAQIIAHFDRLLVRGKKGVAIVRNGVCSGCHMQLPTGALATLRHGNDLQLCETCGRYLYLAEEPEAPIPAVPLKASTKSKRKNVAHAH